MQEIIIQDIDETFNKYVRNKTLPKNDFEKQAILIKITEQFSDQEYSEDQVNNIIKKFYDDFALIRRELINFGYMQRDSLKGTYKVLKRKLYYEDLEKNTILKVHAKPFLK